MLPPHHHHLTVKTNSGTNTLNLLKANANTTWEYTIQYSNIICSVVFQELIYMNRLDHNITKN